VAPGVAVRTSITTLGTYDFGTADAILVFTKNSGGGNNSKYPGGDVIVYKLESKPSGLPAANLNYSNRYWIIRNFGTNATINTLQTLTYRQSGFNSSGNSLFKRTANDFGATWGNSISTSTTSSSSANGGTQVFNGLKSIVTTFGQFTIGGTSTPLLKSGGIITEIEPDNQKEGLSISPNPVDNILQLSYKESNAKTTDWVMIENISGKQMLRKQVNTESGIILIDVSGFTSGTYVLKIGTKTGKFIKL
jgi:hypothetical protein